MHLKGLMIAAGGAVLVVGVAASPAGAAKPLSVVVEDDTLTVTGSSRDDTIALAASALDVTVDLDGDGTADETVDRSTFDTIVVDTGSHDDFVSFTGDFTGETTTIEGGSGNDRLLGTNQADVFDAGSGNDFVDGQQGNDTAVLGSGTDTFQWDPGDGNDTIDGRSGQDTLLFNGSLAAEDMRLFADGSDAVFTRNVANIRMDMTKVERLDVRALGGADLVTIDDMSGTAFRNADVNLSAIGGGSDGATDTVTVVGTDDDDEIDVSAANSTISVDGLQVDTTISGSSAPEGDSLQIDGQGGDDEINVANGVANLIQVIQL